MLNLLRYVALFLGSISFGLGGVIIWSAWSTLRPRRGVQLMFWHVCAITLSTWGFHVLFLLRVVSDLPIFVSYALFPGIIPFWYLLTGALFLALNNVAFWLILKVQRGRRYIQRRGA